MYFPAMGNIKQSFPKCNDQYVGNDKPDKQHENDKCNDYQHVYYYKVEAYEYIKFRQSQSRDNEKMTKNNTCFFNRYKSIE